jgi:DNA-binding transcriptional MerR regulator
MTNEQLDLIERAAQGSSEYHQEPWASPCDTLKLVERIRRLTLELEGARKGLDLQAKGMESQCEQMHELKQKTRKLEQQLTERELECNRLTNETARLLSGRFTKEELQGLCHNLSNDDCKAFVAGCFNYQCDLFGYERARDALMGMIYEKWKETGAVSDTIPREATTDRDTD